MLNLALTVVARLLTRMSVADCKMVSATGKRSMAGGRGR